MKTEKKFLLYVISSLLLILSGGFFSREALADCPSIPYGQPSHVSLTLEGCRNDGTITLPIGGKFICPDSDYTTGNLGKGWNELDLVPYRFTADAGNAAPTTQSYTIATVLDYLNTTKPGYDVVFLSPPILNTTLSSATCPAAAYTDEIVATPGLGGIDQSIYRLISIVGQPKNTTCVYDYTGRLAIGSHLWPGASLHANLALPSTDQSNGCITTSGIGSKDVSLPVNAIESQTISKDMSATQDCDYTWSITKSPTPATLSFGDTCSPEANLDQTVTLKIEWEKVECTPGAVNIVTHVYAHNVASRQITVDVTDVIYGNLGSGDEALNDCTASSGPVVVDANTDQLVLTHTCAAPSNVTGLRDEATASYTDTITGVPIPETSTASASADIQAGTTTNSTASISDTESITGDGFSFSVDSVTGASGSFAGGYTLGTETTNNVTWNSDQQTGSGSVTFDKTVYLDQPRIVDGSLDDEATLNASDGFNTKATKSIGISADATVSLTIEKTIPDILEDEETLSVTFDVCLLDDAGGTKDCTQVSCDCAAGAENSWQKTVDFSAGETDKSVTTSNLKPGYYQVTEEHVTGLALTSANPQIADINLPTCSKTVTFNNELNADELAKAQVRKVTTPAGNEGGWTFQLRDGSCTGTILDEETTSDTAYVDFNWTLEDGTTYCITETLKDHWKFDTKDGDCEFTVDYPADFGKTFQCTYENRELGSLKVTKTVDCNGIESCGGTFEICIKGPSYPDTANCKNTTGGDLTWNDLIPGNYAVSETDPGNEWTVNITGTPASVTAGNEATASVTNTRKLGSLKVTKTVNWNGITPDTNQTFEICIKGPSYPDTANCKTIGYNGGDLTWNDLIPGQYTVTETSPGSMWTVDITGSPATVPTDGGQGTASVTNTHKLGSLKVTKIVDCNGIVGCGGTFEICITGPSYATPNCKSTTGGDLTWTNLIPGNYTVSETNPGSEWTVEVTGGTPATVPDTGGMVSASVKNTYKPGYVTVVKLTNGAQSAAAAWNFTLNGTGVNTSASTPPASFDFGGVKLIPGETYTLCETGVPAGWTALWSLGGNTVTPTYDSNTGNYCYDFTVVPDETASFRINNTYPGGGQRTIGYWKNWSTCTGGNQVNTAEKNGGPDAGWFLLDDLLPQTLGCNSITISTCQQGVSILDKTDIISGKKMAGDAAYALAAQLLAAKLNLAAGASDCGVSATITAADALLCKIGFTGHGSYLPSGKNKQADRDLALQYADILDQYNNGTLCIPIP